MILGDVVGDGVVLACVRVGMDVFSSCRWAVCIVMCMSDLTTGANLYDFSSTSSFILRTIPFLPTYLWYRITATSPLLCTSQHPHGATLHQRPLFSHPLAFACFFPFRG